MNTHLEEMLREGMRRHTESVSLPEDLLSRAVGRYQLRRMMVRRLVAGGAAVGVVALAIGLVFGVVLPGAAEQPSVAQIMVSTAASVPVTTTAPVSTTGPGIIADTVPVALVLQKTLATMTPAEGEVLHIKTTTIFDGTFTVEKGTGTGEIWQIDGSSWMWRMAWKNPGQEVQEAAESSSGPHYVYDGKSGSMLGLPKDPGEPKFPAREWQSMIQSLLASGRAVEDGHEQIDGKDAIRIVEKPNPEEGVHVGNVYLLDATTGKPLEMRLANEGETIHFDVYETLPATPENLAPMDMKAAHPTATAYTDWRAYESAVGPGYGLVEGEDGLTR